MTNPSNRYEDLTPTRHEKAAEVTDTEINEELERGDVDGADISGPEIRHDEGARPQSGRNDAPQPPTEESQDHD
jgi:hypothetical protein